MKYLYLCLLVLASCGVVTGVVDFCGKKSKAACQDRENCTHCYCSFECGPREKKPEDTLIYIENDPRGIYCYCQERDVKAFEKNKCNIKEATR